jgi:DNA replication protein DnaC
MESVNRNYLNALINLGEDVFTRDIIKPLFESMGYDKVDFNGGPYERGRDLIAQRKIPPKKENYIVYVQSKKIGSIQNTSTAAKLSTLIHQLRQCCLGKLTDFEGKQIQPSEVYMACPETISSRLIEELETQLFNMPVKVHPYDGPQILADIREYNPRLLNVLSSIEDKLTSNKNLAPSTKELFSALKTDKSQSIDDIYSDLSFFVGSFDSNVLLHLEIKQLQSNLQFSATNWKIFKDDIKKISIKYKLSLLMDKTTDIETRFNDHKELYEGAKNKALIKKLKVMYLKLEDLVQKIKNNLSAMDSSLNPDNNLTLKSLSKSELNQRIETLAKLKFCFKSTKNPKITKFKISQSTFYEESNLIISLISEKNTIEKSLVSLESKLIKSPFYDVYLNADALEKYILNYKNNYIKNIDKINNKTLGTENLKSFLISTERILSLISKLRDQNSLLSQIITFKEQDKKQDRVSISPHDIFSTGHDIAVYGGAGVGKTTTLQAYADLMYEYREKELIYIPLNRLVDDYKKFMGNVENIENIKQDLLIKIILLSKGITPTQEQIEDVRGFLSGKIVIILDGLDEVYNEIPQIISAISTFKLLNPNTQFIVSSRDCVSYLNDIDFLGITLLPFTLKQLNKFIYGWFGSETDKAKTLISAIKKRGLFDYIKTPLLATITCSLVKKGVDAPSSENEIYSERLNLFTGEYDSHKNIERQKQKGELLRKCAMKIAFDMHSSGVRSETKEEMEKVLGTTLIGIYERPLLNLCLKELINPCNILVQDPLTKKYSFGHFRFQEHLASLELKFNRSIDLSELLFDDWWRGALCLYAQDNDVASLIEDTYNRYGNLRNSRITFIAMIKSKAQKEQSGLLELLTEYEKADRYDEIAMNDIYDDHSLSDHSLNDYGCSNIGNY